MLGDRPGSPPTTAARLWTRPPPPIRLWTVVGPRARHSRKGPDIRVAPAGGTAGATNAPSPGGEELVRRAQPVGSAVSIVKSDDRIGKLGGDPPGSAPSGRPGEAAGAGTAALTCTDLPPVVGIATRTGRLRRSCAETATKFCAKHPGLGCNGPPGRHDVPSPRALHRAFTPESRDAATGRPRRGSCDSARAPVTPRAARESPHHEHARPPNTPEVRRPVQQPLTPSRRLRRVGRSTPDLGADPAKPPASPASPAPSRPAPSRPGPVSPGRGDDTQRGHPVIEVPSGRGLHRLPSSSPDVRGTLRPADPSISGPTASGCRYRSRPAAMRPPPCPQYAPAAGRREGRTVKSDPADEATASAPRRVRGASAAREQHRVVGDL